MASLHCFLFGIYLWIEGRPGPPIRVGVDHIERVPVLSELFLNVEEEASPVNVPVLVV